MTSKKTIIFLTLSGAFALVHQVAIAIYLYWYYWWFDIMMHFWGGALIALGVHALSDFRIMNYKPTLKVVLCTLVLMAGVWEVFEWLVGIYDPAMPIMESTKDIIVGLSGGLLAHRAVSKYTIET